MPSPSRQLPRAVRLATHLYHLLIRPGPEEFLQEYEEYMLSDFRRHCHEVYQRQGIWGLLRECLPMFIKASVDMSEERAFCQKKETVEDSAISGPIRSSSGLVFTSYEAFSRWDSLTQRQQDLLLVAAKAKFDPKFIEEVSKEIKSQYNKKGGIK